MKNNAVSLKVAQSINNPPLKSSPQTNPTHLRVQHIIIVRPGKVVAEEVTEDGSAYAETTRLNDGIAGIENGDE